MSTTTILPGAYAADPIHSSFGFAGPLPGASRSSAARSTTSPRRSPTAALEGVAQVEVDLDPHA